jgi:hypothetical protein
MISLIKLKEANAFGGTGVTSLQSAKETGSEQFPDVRSEVHS